MQAQMVKNTAGLWLFELTMSMMQALLSLMRKTAHKSGTLTVTTMIIRLFGAAAGSGGWLNDFAQAFGLELFLTTALELISTTWSFIWHVPEFPYAVVHHLSVDTCAGFPDSAFFSVRLLPNEFRRFFFRLAAVVNHLVHYRVILYHIWAFCCWVPIVFWYVFGTHRSSAHQLLLLTLFQRFFSISPRIIIPYLNVWLSTFRSPSFRQYVPINTVPYYYVAAFWQTKSKALTALILRFGTRWVFDARRQMKSSSAMHKWSCLWCKLEIVVFDANWKLSSSMHKQWQMTLTLAADLCASSTNHGQPFAVQMGDNKTA